MLIEPPLQLETNWENSILKSHDHWSATYQKLKNSLEKITQLSRQEITFGSFLARCVIFVKHHFCGCRICLPQVEHLSCAIFVRYHYFHMALRGTFSAGWYFCCVYLMVLFLFYFIASYMHKEYSLGFSNCNYLIFCQYFELVIKHEISIV